MPRHGIFIKDKSLFQHLLDYFVILTLARFTPTCTFSWKIRKSRKIAFNFIIYWTNAQVWIENVWRCEQWNIMVRRVYKCFISKKFYSQWFMRNAGRCANQQSYQCPEEWNDKCIINFQHQTSTVLYRFLFWLLVSIKVRIMYFGDIDTLLRKI